MVDMRLFGIGAEFAGYRIEEYLASGGVAEVYKARDLKTNAIVALKVIPQDLAQDEQFRERFTRESQLAGKLRHPNIVPVYASGEHDGMLYIALRFVESGEYDRADLRAVLTAEGPFDLPMTLWILGQVAGALDHAHRHGLVHRDVTPHNVLVERGSGRLEDARAYLTDFGITRPTASRSLSASRTTGTEGFVGTLHYVAPEQVRNAPANPRTDVYALGCVAFEMLTMRPPFAGREHEAAVIFAILDEAPPPVGVDGLPDGVDKVLGRALAKRPEDRYATATDLVADLERVADPSLAAAEAALVPVGTDGREVGAVAAIGVSDLTSLGSRPAADAVPRSGGGSAKPRRRLRFLPAGRKGVALAAALAVLVAAGVVALVTKPWQDTRYGGGRREAPVAFDHPASWHEHAQSGSFVLFSPMDLRGLFANQPEVWSTVTSALDGDRTKVVGVYVRAADTTADPSDPDAQLREITPDLQGNRVTWDVGSRAITVAGRAAHSFTGRLRAPTSTYTLQIRAVVLRLDPEPRALHMIFFAPGPPPDRSVFDRAQSSFRGVLDSLDLT